MPRIDANWEDEYDEVEVELGEGDRGGHLAALQFKSARREFRRNNRRKMGVAGRSVFELQRLRARPMKPRRRRS